MFGFDVTIEIPAGKDGDPLDALMRVADPALSRLLVPTRPGGAGRVAEDHGASVTDRRRGHPEGSTDVAGAAPRHDSDES